MNIEKFIDAFGDDVYALALLVTKNFDSAERVFTQIAQDCDTFPETAEPVSYTHLRAHETSA